ncbi:S8 family peptidase [Mycolicibacterium sp. 018/SC-01/001]|uniref:S8 family peptidase n=1 Tax=Mycolicibacterium sp. 018/SC-01/001 TaxID=2592069 RepID=UPI00117EAD4F|nr:S8 family peptidase [Mycolicibacterium sp. 018/SC-01/001]TRW86249.1 S8 family peptidase [Mycolicibacterium sp. 018/SC-01/001]
MSDDPLAPPTRERSWQARVLCAVRALEELGKPATAVRIKEMVGARFAAVFLPADRQYEGARPSWEARVDDALATLVTQKLLRIPRGKTTDTAWATTAAGKKQAAEDCSLGAVVAEDTGPVAEPITSSGPIMAGVVTKPLQGTPPPPAEHTPIIGITGPTVTVEYAGRIPFDTSGDQGAPKPVMIELNLQYGVGTGSADDTGVTGAVARVEQLWELVGATGTPVVVADQYMSGDLSDEQVKNIVTADSAGGEWPQRAIFRIWPDFPIHPQIDASGATIKATTAQRAFAAYGQGIVWAVVDSGIDGSHPHFQGDHTLDDPSVADLHRDFTSASVDPTLALVDEDGHGTHVAGIIAGGLQHWKEGDDARHALAVEKRQNNGAVGNNDPILVPRDVDIELLNGVAPLAKLVSLKVLSKYGDLTARTARVIAALAYVRQKNDEAGKLTRIHGVNLSLGYGFLADWFGCGQSPLCLEVNRLVSSGVVVVVAAGNSGYVTLNATQSDVTQFSAGVTINDPGNAEKAITVGSTHRNAPHTNGISFFSSRGPTGDGRPKPDLVAPGERITSAAAGKNLAGIQAANFPHFDGAAVYIEDSGTSMAAPHVSGAIAAFLSVQREYVGKPDDVKEIFMSSATSLNRDRYFQGAGLVDLMRALQTP